MDKSFIRMQVFDHVAELIQCGAGFAIIANGLAAMEAISPDLCKHVCKCGVVSENIFMHTADGMNASIKCLQPKLWLPLCLPVQSRDFNAWLHAGCMHVMSNPSVSCMIWTSYRAPTNAMPKHTDCTSNNSRWLSCHAQYLVDCVKSKHLIR